MPTFFLGDSSFGAVGRVVGCNDPHTQGTTNFVRLDPTIAFSSHKSIITRITVAHQGNYQFLHTIGNSIYIYVFGDRIGQINISGLSFTRDCTGGDPDGPDHGFERIFRYYAANRVAARQDPIKITFGQQTVIKGFVVGMSGDAVDPQTRIMQYGLNVMVLPEKKDSGGGGAGGRGGGEERATPAPVPIPGVTQSQESIDAGIASVAGIA